MYNDVINEYCVSLDTAKLLKELGYNEPCIACYQHNTFIPVQIYNDNITLGNYNDTPDYMEQCSAPTYNNVQEWLEKVYHIGIIVRKKFKSYEYEIYYNIDNRYDDVALVNGFMNYNDAYETAIRRCAIYIKQNTESC